MTADISWLPDVFKPSGDPETDLRALRKLFEAEMVGLEFRGLDIRWDRGSVQKHEVSCDSSFWHVVSGKSGGAQRREYDPDRAAMMPWLPSVLKNHHDGEVLVFDYEERRGHLRTYLWLHRYDYVVVLEAKGKGDKRSMWLVTAYPVCGESTRRRLRQKMSRSVRSKGAG